MKALIRAIQDTDDGTHDAHEKLFAQVQKPLFGFVSARVSEREDAIDITQKVCVAFFRGIHSFQYRSDAQVYAYMFTIARRQLAHYYERNRLHEAYTQENMRTQEGVTSERELIEHMDIRACVDALPQKFRELIELHYWAGLPLKTIAQMNQESVSAIKVRHHRAKRALREAYET